MRLELPLQSQSAAWGELDLLDRTPLVAEDGSRANLDPDLTAAIVESIGAGSPAGLRAFVNELLYSEGIVSMEDLNGEQLTEIIQGILGV